MLLYFKLFWLSSLSGSSVRLRGQQHNYRGALWCLGKAQEFRHEFLLQQKFCVQRSLGVVGRTPDEGVGLWTLLMCAIQSNDSVLVENIIKSVVCPNSNT